MRHFWPWFFLFLIVVFIMIGLARPDLMNAALVGLGGFLVIFAWVVIAALIGLGALLGYAAYTKYSMEARRPVDGAFPLQKKRLAGGATMYINPNMMIGPAAIVDKHGNYSEPEHPAGWAAVGAVRAAVERTNMVRAMFPGDRARMNQHGAMSDSPRINAGTMRQLDREVTYKAEQAAPMLPDKRPAVHASIGPQTAFAGNTRTQIALGNTDEGVHRWDMTLDPHIRFHGATQGAGKTNAAKTLLLGAMLKGHRVIVCDRRRFKNFAGWQGRAELVATNDGGAFVGLLEQLVEFYQAVDRQLSASGRPDVGDGQRIVALVAEFGALCKQAQADGSYSDMAHRLGLIVREAGACGVHMIFEDQVAVRGTWPPDVIANSAAYVGRMPSRGGQTVGYYHSDKLAPYSFYHGGEIVATWNMAECERDILRVVPETPPLFGRSVRSLGVTTTSNEQRTNSERTVDRTTDLQSMVWAWRDRNPDGTQADMRREIEISRGYANQLWHTWPGPGGPATGAEQLAEMGINVSDIQVKGRPIR